MTQPNQAQAELWNNQAGQNWVEQNAMLDRLFAPFEPLLVDAVQGATAVLDIGCGAGATTFAVARSLGAQGRCTGADISAPLIELARRKAVETGADNTEFLVADAQQHAFPPTTFDAVISRFGVMFFDDPVAAFANLRRAARTDARLAMVAWRRIEDNPFMSGDFRRGAFLSAGRCNLSPYPSVTPLDRAGRADERRRARPNPDEGNVPHACKDRKSVV